MKRRRILLFSLLLIWMGLIFWFSAQSRTDSAALSSKLLRKLLALSPDWKTLSAAKQNLQIKALHHAFRKLAHFTEYAVLGIFASLTMRCGFPAEDKKQQRVRYFFVPACFALLFSAADELHQVFSPGRTPQASDIGIDFLGACAGIFLIAFLARRIQQRHIKANKNGVSS